MTTPPPALVWNLWPAPAPGMYLINRNGIAYSYWDGVRWTGSTEAESVRTKWAHQPQRDAGIEPEVPNE